MLRFSNTLAEGHHGYIHVESEEGKGTVFTLVFPKPIGETEK
nr:hypothetical protein [Ectobacillus panaciterrae]